MACQQCNFSTNIQEELINHCAQMYQSSLKVESKHPIWNDDDNNQRCLICNQDFPDRGAFNVHMESHMKWISCQFCKFKSHHSDAMQQHIMTEHRDVSSQRQPSNAYTSEDLAEAHFSCFLCTDTPEFLDRHALNIHMKSHMKSVTCHFCNYKGSSNAAVQQHILRMHRDVSLQCQASNACTSEGLGEVESVNNDLRCLLCSDTPEFLDKSALKIHMESHMKWISCHLCEYKSHNSESMKRHKKAQKAISSNSGIQCMYIWRSSRSRTSQ